MSRPTGKTSSVLDAASTFREARPWRSPRDRFICEQVGPVLVEKGLNFVGLDVIGEYLTEINVTCPTCIRELNEQFNLDIAGDYIDFVAAEIG